LKDWGKTTPAEVSKAIGNFLEGKNLGEVQQRLVTAALQFERESRQPRGAAPAQGIGDLIAERRGVKGVAKEQGAGNRGNLESQASNLEPAVLKKAQLYAEKAGLDLDGWSNDEISDFVGKYDSFVKSKSRAAEPIASIGDLIAQRRAMNQKKGTPGIEAGAHEAATSPLNDLAEPSEAQVKAGNYRKGHVSIQGLDISIENPAGSVRSGKDQNGKPWSTAIHHHYGYIKGTVGKDKDHIDTFIGDKPEGDRVFVVDQIDPKSGTFDEHKVMIGFDSKNEATLGYLRNYDDTGQTRIGDVSEMTMDDFKAWLKSGKTKTPVGQLKRGDESQGKGKPAVQPANEARGKIVAKLKASGADEATAGKIADLIAEEYAGKKTLGPAWLGKRIKEGWIDKWKVQTQLKSGGKELEDLSPKEIAALPEGKVDHPVTAALKGKGADLDKQQGEAKEKAEIGGVSDKELDDKAANEALREKVADLGEARSTSTDEVQAKNKERFKEAQRKHLRKKIAEARSEADKTRLAKLLGKLQERKQEITEKPATSIDDEVKNLSLDDLSAMFDEVAAESQPKVETRTVEQATPGTSSRMSLKETVHSKKGHTLFVVTMNERVERDEYDRLNRDAKRTGNGYSSYRGHGAVPGFQFLDKSAAEEFMQRWGGEGKAVETLDVSKEDPQQARTATEILKEAASQGIEGVGDAVTGLYELFGGAALKSFPGGLDEATYSKAKPHFQAAFDRFREAGKGIKEFFRFLIEQFGPGIKPYSMKFVAELQGNSFKELNKTRGSLTESASNDNIVNENSTINEEGTDRDDTGNGGNGPQALESVPSGDVPGDGETRRPDKRVGSSGKTDATRDGYIDDERDDGIGSLGSVEVPVHLQRPVEGLQPGLEHVPTPASEPRSLFLSGENPGNYRIAESDRIGEGTRGQRIDSNMAAIRIAKQLQAEGRYATRTEQSALARYVGWGGLKSVFDPTSTKPQDQKARAELESLLTKEEYFEARQSVLNAHYTSREVIGAIYDMARHFGFSGGNVLEPTFGIGNFIGFMPSELAASSKWYGAELDPITAVIGKHLYPDSQLLNVGFQQAEFPYNKFDLAIGNPPFGDERITDTNKRRSEIDGMKIHNYVIAKAGMHLKPGKLMAMVVTSRFLDTANPEARGHLAKDFSFLGAIRLPNNAFAKSAGTDVVTDLVFFRKLMPDEKPDLSADWLTTGATLNNEDGEAVTLNKYFAERPHLMIGKPSMQGSMYGGGARGDQFTLSAREGQDTGAYIESLLGKDFASLKDVLKERVNDQAEAAAVSLEMNREDVGVGGYVPEGSDVFMREDDDADGNPVFVKLTAETQWTEKTKLGKTRLDRIKGMLELRGQTYKLIEMERFDQPGIERHRTQLNRLYDAFVKAHGYINDSANAGLMADDVKIEFGLEVNYRKPISVSRAKSMGVKPQGAKADKASLLKERVFYPQKEITTAANARDGYGISLSEKGRLDLEYIARLTGKEKKEVITELADEGLILQDPETLEWVQEDEYLSGNVKAKLKSVQHREGYERNAAALKKVQPKDVATDDIFADLGSTWIPAKVYEDFADLMGIKGAKAHVSDATGTVTIVDHKSINQNDMNVLLKNDDYTIAELFNFIANKRAVVAYDHDSEGKRFVNKDRTKLLVPIAKRFTATFRDWIMADPMRAQELTKLYNDTQNTHAERVFDGKHLKTVGANPAIIMRNTQRNAAWRMIQAPVTLLDHVVGSGKTYTIITGIMERRRLGLSRKPLVVVPNHLVGQWAKDFLRLYPGANILAATEKDFSKPNRRRLFSRIATGNFDAVIVGHSSFGFIPLEQETEIKFVQEEMEYLERALSDAASAEDKRTVRTLTNRIAKKRERIARLQNRDRDNVATFESMGIDHLTVDESHEFKNLEYSTSMQNVTGMGSPAGAKKSFDLYAKIRYLRSEDGAVTFATGTPISNSLVEMYTLLRYLNLEGLKERRLDAFDAWAKSYAGIETRIEYTATQKLKERGVMAEFNNLPELLQLYTEFADIVSMSDLKRIYAEQIRESNRATGANEREEFPVPKVKDGARVLDIADPLASQREFMDYLVARATRLERLGGQNDPKIDNHLWVMNDARKMALDIRLVDPLAPADPNNKIGRSAKNIKRIYDKWTADKGTQLVFCDLSTPAKQSDKDAKKFIKDSLTVLAMQKDTRVQAVLDSLTWREQWSYLKNRMEAKVEELNNALQENSNLSDADEKSLNNWMNDLEKYLEEVSDEDEAALTTADTGFSVYDDLKSQLVSMGIPENEIRFIHEANTKDKKEELFGMVNSGEVRVLLGSSKKMGAGTNVQERVVALHHLDAPWRPSDVEQREGRAVRQGNTLYDRDPDGFELELIAYSTGNTFDAVMWQVLARKAEMLEQFRSGVRSVQEGQSDADSYATFMAESTGNPAFKEKYRLENAIEELEGMQRNVQARRSAAERLAGQREELTNKTKLGIDRAAADLEAVAEAEGFVFEGVTYAEDLDEAQAAAREEYNAAWAMYEKELKEHNGRRTAAIEAQMIKEFGFDKYELRGNEVEKIAIKKWDEEHKAEKPVAPKEVTLTGLAKTSQAAKLGRLIEKHLDEMDEGEIVVKYGGLNVAFTVDEARWGNSSLKKGERKTNDYSITVGNYSESYQAKHPSSKEIVSVLRNGAIKRQLAKELGDAKRQAEYTSKSIADAERILDKVKFSDAAELEEKRSRYVEVVEEVNRLEAEMETRRENESNPYIDRDSRRFSGYDRRSSAAQVQESGAAGETRYSVTADQPTYGLPAADIQTAFEPVYKNMPNSPPWRVVQTTAELPKRALDNAAKRGIPQRMLQAVYLGNEVVYVADNFRSMEEAKEVILEEVVVHHGLRGIMAKDAYEKHMLQAALWYANKRNAEWKDLAEQYKLDLKDRDDRIEAAEEMLGRDARTGMDSTILSKVIAAVKEFLRSVGWNAGYGDAEIRELLGKARRFVEGKEQGAADREQGTGIDYGAMLRILREQGVTDDQLEAFANWQPGAARYAAAWHGSPHDFVAFKSQHIGSGEGAQAYGYGLYFAGNKEVAEYYKKAVAALRTNMSELAETLKGVDSGAYSLIEKALTKDDFHGTGPLAVGSIVQSLMSGQPSMKVVNLLGEDFKRVYDAVDSLPSKGKLYHVELAPSEDEYLLWDKHLSEQSEKVKAAIAKGIKNHQDEVQKDLMSYYAEENKDKAVGGTFYKTLTSMLGDGTSTDGRKEASEYLHSLGIRGIKYLDGTSRNKSGYKIMWENGQTSFEHDKAVAESVAKTFEAKYGKATITPDDRGADYNYVIFDESDVSITAKFALARLEDVKGQIVDKGVSLNTSEREVLEADKAKAIEAIETTVRDYDEPGRLLFRAFYEADQHQSPGVVPFNPDRGHFAAGEDLRGSWWTTSYATAQEIAWSKGRDGRTVKIVALPVDKLPAGRVFIQNTNPPGFVYDLFVGLPADVPMRDVQEMPVDTGIRFALADRFTGYVGEMKGGDVWKRIARLLNPFDWSRLKGMIENVTPQSIMNGAASFLRNPIFEAEADENKKPFVENGVKREQTKLDYLLRFLGWDGPSADNPNIMERLKKTYSQWESGDRTTGWGRITDGYQKLSAADRKGVDWLLYQGDMQGRVFKDFETAVKDPRVSKGKPTETAFTMYQQVRNHIDTVVADTVEAISRQFMYDAGLPDVVIEKHLSDYRNRLAERPGWLPRNHGDGDHQVNVYQHITGLKWETRGDKDSMQALLPYYPSKEVADEIKKLATGYGLKYRNLAGGQQLITTDKNASSRFKKEVAKLKGQIEAATGDEKSKLELQLDAVERQRIFAESMPADQIKRFRTKAAEIIPKLQLRNELGIREREKALKQALEDGESESTINMLKDELKKLGDGRIRVKVYMRLKETKSRAEKHKAEVEKDLQKFMPGNYLDWAKYEVEQRFSDQISEDMYGDMKNDFAMEQGQLAAINKAAAHQEISKKEAAALRQTILQSTAEVLMARGAGAHRIRRAEYLIEGYDAENTVDAYHDYMTGTSGMLSKARYAQEQFEQFRYAKPEVKRWAHTYIVNNLRNMGFADQVSGNMRALATLTYLGFKVSSMLINSTQPWTLGVAELGRHTKRSAVWAIGKAQTDIVIGKLSESEKRLFASEIFKLQEMETAVHEMSGQQEGFTGKVSRFMHTLTDKALMPFQEVELLNRKTVILAAYRTFRADGISRNEALQKALQVNRTVNFEMSRANLPGFAQKPLGRTVYALQSFMWNNWNWIYNRMTSGEKEDMKALLRYAVAMGIIGGAMALPGGDELDKLYQTLFGESPKLALQKWTAKHAKEYGSLGEMVNGFAWHGAASAAGVNISNAIRLQIPIVSPLIGGESLPDAAGGVFTGLVQKGSRATVAASRGDMYRALENLSPEALAGAMRAYRMSTKGATTTSGKILFDEDGKPMKYTAGEAVKRTLGFQPTRVSKRSDLTNIEYGLTAHWKEERGDLLAKLRIATGDERKKVMLKIMRFNRDLRESQAAGLVPIIKEQTIRQALVSKPNKGKMAWEKNQLND
jgi:N12 class adenine-specific DNA methylase